MKILDGKAYSEELINNYKKLTSGKSITLGIITSEEDDSKIYLNSKIKACKQTNIKVKIFKVKSENELPPLIKKLNNDNITGILIDNSLPNFLDIINLLSKEKDVEGLTQENIYDLYMGREKIVPCTAKGIIKLLKKYKIEIRGKNVVIIGRGITTGKPLMHALENRDATVTLCHSKTKNLKEIFKQADILISMVGKPNMINKNMVKKGFIGIDAGINKVDGKIVGDFNFKDVSSSASYITKVPGGVGPMTTAMLIENLIELYNAGGK